MRALTSGVLLLCAVPAAAETRISEHQEDAAAAWRGSGFRMTLGLGFETLQPLGSEPDPLAVALTLQPGWRVQEYVSIHGLFRYSALLGSFVGLRWLAGLGVGFHPLAGFELALSIGYGGILAEGDGPDAVRTSGGFDACNGGGVAGVVSWTYLIVVGELFATGPQLQGGVQATECTEDRLVASSVGEPVNARVTEWWGHASVTGSWVFSWR